MTTITLTPDLETALAERAKTQGTTPETLVLETLREKFSPLLKAGETWASQDEWERRLRAAAVHAEVSLTDEQVSREVIYEDHD